jgi:hypothetical protein
MLVYIIITLLYRVFSDFMSVLKDIISEVIPSQKCHEHGSISQWLQSYGQKLKMIRSTQNKTANVLPSMMEHPIFQSKHDGVPE